MAKINEKLRTSIEEIDRKIDGGFVYLVKSEGGLFKVGSALNVQRRIESLQIGNPYELELVWADKFKEYKKLEAMVHERFQEKRVRGEWFRLETGDLAIIESLSTIPIVDKTEEELKTETRETRKQRVTAWNRLKTPQFLWES